MSTNYTQYIIDHKANVLKAYLWLKEHEIVDLSLEEQINAHDLSKYTEEEYDPYDNYFYGNKTEKVKREFDYAWLNHIHQNPHHWQYWVDYTRWEIVVNKIPYRHALEYVADVLSASKVYNPKDINRKNKATTNNTRFSVLSA